MEGHRGRVTSDSEALVYRLASHLAYAQRAMRNCFAATWLLLVTGPLAASVAGYSKNEAPRDARSAQSLANLKAKAVRGDAGSQITLGFKCLEGQGVAANINEGLDWIARGISQMEKIVASATPAGG